MVRDPVIAHGADIGTAALGAATGQRRRSEGDRYDHREHDPAHADSLEGRDSRADADDELLMRDLHESPHAQRQQ
jgi:hypothetical protein